MTDAKDAMERIRDALNDYRVMFTGKIRREDLVTVLDRLEAAERVIDAARSVDISIRKHRPIDNNDAEELAQELCKYDERFGGRNA